MTITNPPVDSPPPGGDLAPGGHGGADNRGHKATIGPNGEAVGSGASAGGGGGPEDLDADPQSGGGAVKQKHGDRPDRGGDAAQHGSA